MLFHEWRRIRDGTLSRAGFQRQMATFEDKPEEGPVDAEELYIGAEEVATEGEAAAAHLATSPLEALEAKAKRARERGAG